MKRLKTISEEIMFENQWHKYKHDVFEKPNGERGDYYYMETPGAVVIVPMLDDGRIVMIREYYYLLDKQTKAFPCGGIEPGQNMVEAARAELYQETGCISDEFVHLGSFEPSAGSIKDETHVYLAYVAEVADQHLDDTEQIEVIYRRAHEVEEMILKNDVCSGQSIAAWMMARNHVAQAVSRAEAG